MEDAKTKGSATLSVYTSKETLEKVKWIIDICSTEVVKVCYPLEIVPSKSSIITKIFELGLEEFEKRWQLTSRQ